MTYPWLQGPLTTASYGWRLERGDGIAIGFTSHDRDILLDGLVYRASPGIAPTSIVQGLGLEANSLEVSGALTSDALSAADIEAGKWDGASLDIFLFDWTDPDAQPLPLASGILGAINWSGSAFEVEFLGPSALLSAPSVPATSPTCRAKFAGEGCGLNPRRFTLEALVMAVNGSELTLQQALTGDVSRFVNGDIRWLSGRNCGFRQRIAASTQDKLVLIGEPPFPTPGPERIEILEGCDRTIATCSSRFNNALNFRGEPYLPGNDLLTRYPGAN